MGRSKASRVSLWSAEAMAIDSSGRLRIHSRQTPKLALIRSDLRWQTEHT
jgi:hypothetical protein